jgi:hypothetical protein
MFLDPNMPPINILSMTPPLAIFAFNKAHALSYLEAVEGQLSRSCFLKLNM